MADPNSRQAGTVRRGFAQTKVAQGISEKQQQRSNSR